jgi:hypothetical protein
MASHTVVKAKHASASAATVDTITFTGSGGNIRVLNRGDNPLSFSVDGSVPTALGDDTLYAGPGENVVVSTQSKVVKLISTVGTDYSVERY